MNYREQQLRSIIKKDYVPKNLYQQVKHDYDQILADTDYQLQKQTSQKSHQLEKELAEIKTDIDNYLKSKGVKNFLELTKLIQQGQQAQEANPLYLKKIEDLETQLLNLAKQKIKGKKEAEELLEKLETDWKNKRAESKKHWTAKEKDWQKQIQEKTQQLNISQSQQEQSAQEIKRIKGRNEVAGSPNKKEQDNNHDLQKELTDQKDQHQNQLRQINVLFNPQAENYKFIDFNGLYKLLQELRSLNTNTEILVAKNQTIANLEAQIEQNKQTTNQNQSLIKEIEDIINSRLTVFLGKAKVLNYLEELKNHEPNQ